MKVRTDTSPVPLRLWKGPLTVLAPPTHPRVRQMESRPGRQKRTDVQRPRVRKSQPDLRCGDWGRKSGDFLWGSRGPRGRAPAASYLEEAEGLNICRRSSAVRDTQREPRQRALLELTGAASEVGGCFARGREETKVVKEWRRRREVLSEG